MGQPQHYCQVKPKYMEMCYPLNFVDISVVFLLGVSLGGV